MSQGKYVILRGRGPVLFSEAITHAKAAIGNSATSAGFFKVYIEDDKLVVFCHGESESLGVASNPAKDSNAILSLLTGCTDT